MTPAGTGSCGSCGGRGWVFVHHRRSPETAGGWKERWPVKRGRACCLFCGGTGLQQAG